jgi:hypothetical protein
MSGAFLAGTRGQKPCGYINILRADRPQKYQVQASPSAQKMHDP